MLTEGLQPLVRAVPTTLEKPLGTEKGLDQN